MAIDSSPQGFDYMAVFEELMLVKEPLELKYVDGKLDAFGVSSTSAGPCPSLCLGAVRQALRRRYTTCRTSLAKRTGRPICLHGVGVFGGIAATRALSVG